jgi:hypothetical protein
VVRLGLGVGLGLGLELDGIAGGVPDHSTQYSLSTTRSGHLTPGLKLMNCASVMLHASDSDWQVSPLMAGQVKEQSRG